MQHYTFTSVTQLCCVIELKAEQYSLIL